MFSILLYAVLLSVLRHSGDKAHGVMSNPSSIHPKTGSARNKAKEELL